MSKTPSEFVDDVLAALSPEALRKAAADPGDAVSMACIIVDRVVGQLDTMRDMVVVLEMIKFKRMIGDLPEQWWPKPNIQKGTT